MPHIPVRGNNPQENQNVENVNNAGENYIENPRNDMPDNEGQLENDILQEAVRINRRGMNEEEQRDVNRINVTLADPNIPIIVLFGPPSCGKTMILVRLVRYLKYVKKFPTNAVRSFRPGFDNVYDEICRNFNEMIDNINAADSTGFIQFMLATISDKNGKPLCQILEAPGEHFFNPEDPNSPFPRYVLNIINSNNRKIWAFVVEPDHTNDRMNDPYIRTQYANKINGLSNRIRGKDKAIFIFNKIDESGFVIRPGKINHKSAKGYVENNYTGIFNSFENTTWVNNHEFIEFQTGDFPEQADGTLGFVQGPDFYPERLWKMISKMI